MILSYFREGQECYLAGQPVDSHNYPDDSEAAKSWTAGWDHEWYASHRAGTFK